MKENVMISNNKYNSLDPAISVLEIYQQILNEHAVICMRMVTAASPGIMKNQGYQSECLSTGSHLNNL